MQCLVHFKPQYQACQSFLDYLYDCDSVWLLLLIDRARLLADQAFALILKLAKPDFLRLKL